MLRSALAGSCLLAVALTGCGGGSSGSAPPPPPLPAGLSAADAARLLEPASCGPTPSEVARIAALGLNGYLDEQVALPATGYRGFRYVPHTAAASCRYDPTNPTGAASLCARDNYSLFQVQRQFRENAPTGRDQLRQHVAFALAQIFVTSGVEIDEAYGTAAPREPAARRRPRRLPSAARGRDTEPGDGPLPGHGEQRQGEDVSQAAQETAGRST